VKGAAIVEADVENLKSNVDFGKCDYYQILTSVRIAAQV
jgi:hypothetical protein